MDNLNYKKYSLEKLEEWMHDAMSNGETTSQEIFNVIKGVVEENYHYHKHHVSQAYELLALLNGNSKSDSELYDTVMREKEYYEPSMPPWGHSDMQYLMCNKDDSSLECKGAWDDFWEENYYSEEHKKDEVKKWVLPVQCTEVYDADIYYVNFPDDLLEAANLKEGDEVEWVDNKDGSYTLRNVTTSNTLKMDDC